MSGSRLAANAVAERLATITTAYGYYGGIGRPLPGTNPPADPPAKSDTDLRVQPYFILWPSGPGNAPDRQLCGSPAGVERRYRITAAAGDIEDLLALVDALDNRLLGWRPPITPGATSWPSPIRRLPDYIPDVLTDRATTPQRLYVPLIYTHHT